MFKYVYYLSMKLLEDRILKDGIVLAGDVLKIDGFLNHQIDTKLMEEIGKEFYRLFRDTNPDKILTIESSGIAIAYATSVCFGYIPIVFAKKTYSSNSGDDVYSCVEHSYTRNIDYNVQVSKEYLLEGEKVLILDDFLANGDALNCLINICKQANAEPVGCGVTVAKTYQRGIERIRELGYDVQVLAKIKALGEDGTIEIEEQDV